MPALAPHAVELSLGFVVVLTVVNLRGVKESGPRVRDPDLRVRARDLRDARASASLKVAFGDGHHRGERAVPESTRGRRHRRAADGRSCVLRAFASGCTALTGVEAVTNGVRRSSRPRPQRRDDARRSWGRWRPRCSPASPRWRWSPTCTWPRTPSTLIGLPAGEEQKTALSQIGAGGVRRDPLASTCSRAFTAAILILAANTAFNGFPVLSSLLGRDGYLPRQLAHRGDRLVFSNGIVLLAVVAVGADRRLRRRGHAADPALHPRRVPVVHAQPGRHGPALGASACDRRRAPSARALRRKQALNALGAVVTGLVFVIVLVTKFTHGAWIVVLAAPILFLDHEGDQRATTAPVADELAPTASGVTLPGRIHASSWCRTCRRRRCARWPTPGRRPRRRCGRSRSWQPTRRRPAPSEWERARDPGPARGARVAVPRDRPPGAALRAPAAPRAPRRRRSRS